MAVQRLSNRWVVCGGLLGLSLIIAVSTCMGVLAGSRIASNQTGIELNPLTLKAASAARGKSISMATGSVDGNVEGLFILDHLSGDLQCWLLNSRTGAVGGIYRANVVNDLQVDKTGESEFLMVTGGFVYNGGNRGNLVPGQSVVYVADVNTGDVVGYALMYNRQGIQRGVMQNGPLQLVCKGDARQIAIRDQ